MAIYETEEEQLEALKGWWKENGQSTIVGVIAGIVAILGWNFWQNYKHDQAMQASALYEQLLTAVNEGKSESAEKIADRIGEQYDSTAYSAYAQLLKAKVEVQQGGLDAARQTLEKTVADADDVISHVARLDLIRLLLAKGEYEKGLQLIAEVDQRSAAGFTGSYDELKGDLYVALDRLDEARTAYQSALRGGHTSPLLQFKLDDLTQPEIISNPK